MVGTGERRGVPPLPAPPRGRDLLARRARSLHLPGFLMGGSAPALGVAAAAVVTFWSVRSDAARRTVLFSATVAIGVLLSLRHLAARRLSALLFLLSIVLVLAVWRMVFGRPRAASAFRAETAALIAI